MLTVSRLLTRVDHPSHHSSPAQSAVGRDQSSVAGQPAPVTGCEPSVPDHPSMLDDRRSRDETLAGDERRLMTDDADHLDWFPAETDEERDPNHDPELEVVPAVASEVVPDGVPSVVSSVVPDVVRDGVRNGAR